MGNSGTVSVIPRPPSVARVRAASSCSSTPAVSTLGRGGEESLESVTTRGGSVHGKHRVARRALSLKRLGVAIVVGWFLIGGIAHFAATETEMRIVPPYIPWPRAVVLASGVAELLGAAGVAWRPTRRLAGWGLFALTILVTPAHFYMLQRPDLFDVPYWALVLRLPIQAALLWLIAWSTMLEPVARR